MNRPVPLLSRVTPAGRLPPCSHRIAPGVFAIRRVHRLDPEIDPRIITIPHSRVPMVDTTGIDPSHPPPNRSHTHVLRASTHPARVGAVREPPCLSPSSRHPCRPSPALSQPDRAPHHHHPTLPPTRFLPRPSFSRPYGQHIRHRPVALLHHIPHLTRPPPTSYARQPTPPV